MQNDPCQLRNLVGDPAYADVRNDLATLLSRKMTEAGEKAPTILP